MTSVHSTFATPTERLATYFDGAQPRAAFEDSDIDEIAILLEQCGHVASKCPRTYILCRTIGHLDTIEQLVKAGFTDQWFPVAEARSLPSFLGPSVKCAIIQRQEIILTKSLDLENGRHRHFAPQECLPFEILGRLGSGGYGQVDRILSKTSFKQYALKRIRRRAAFGNISSREALNGFLNEMKIIKSLEHRHIVEYIGSYTDKSYLGLVMSPVADTDLAAYNERLCGHLQADQPERTLSPFYMRDQPTTAELSSNLRTFYGCLTAALAYLHDHSIRHKDIKPQNILVARGNVLFSDFGLSRDFADDVGSTTSGITPASARYCAPEVANYEARNTSSDIWSLGCVFLEMTAALRGLNVEWIKTLFTNSNSHGTHFHSNPIALTELLRELKETVDPSHKRTFTWIEKMLLANRNARPTAAQVLEMITCPETSDMDATPNMFCGICCVPGLESDSADSLADDLDVVTAIPLRKHHIKQDANTRHETSQPEVEAQKVRHLNSSEESLARARPNADSPFEPVDSNPKAEAMSGAPNDTPSKIQAHSVTSKSRDANISSGNKISISPSIDVKSSDSPQREHTQQSATFPQEEMSPSAVVSQSEELFEQSMDKGEPADLITMSREQKGVIGVPLSTSIEYASIYLKSMKTVGGMYLEGRIPTIVARCGEFFRHADNPYQILLEPDLTDDSFLRVLSNFETQDYGQAYSFAPDEHMDCSGVLSMFLSKLPDPLLRKDDIRGLIEIWQYEMSTEEKICKIQTTLLGIPFPNITVILYMLDLFAVCAMDSHSAPRSLAKRFYHVFFGHSIPRSGWSHYMYITILKFMIGGAKDLLGGSMYGKIVSERGLEIQMEVNESIEDDRGAKKERHNTNSTNNLSESGTSMENSPTAPIEAVAVEPERYNDNSLASKPSEPDPPTSRSTLAVGWGDESQQAMVAQLSADGVSQRQLEKYARFVKSYIKLASGPSMNRQDQTVFKIPIWISIQYAGVRRSAHTDFGVSIDIDFLVPDVVAECCQYLINIDFPPPEKVILDGGYFSATMDSVDSVRSIVSDFDSYHEYGVPYTWGSGGIHAGRVLRAYLFSLPEALIPSTHSELLLSSPNDDKARLRSCVETLKMLPKANRDTLLYLMAFFSKFFATSDVIARNFQPAIIQVVAYKDGSPARDMKKLEARSMIEFLICNINHVLESIPGAQPIAPKSTHPQRPDPDFDHVTATYDCDAAMLSKDYLSYKSGDMIRVIKRTDRTTDWWTGELNGERGFFSANQMVLPENFFKLTKQLTEPSANLPPMVSYRNVGPASNFAEPGGHKNSITGGFRKTFRKFFD